MNKLEFMAMSLPYRLKCQSQYGDSDYDFKGRISTLSNMLLDMYVKEQWLPVLRPLSDLKYFESELKRLFPTFIFDKYDISKEPLLECFCIIQKLVEWHFDVAGLIEKGEAVDYHTLPDFVF